MTDLDELKAFVKAAPDPSCAHMDWPGAVLDLIDRVEKAHGRISELEAALKPFADEAENWIEMGDTRPVIDTLGITVGHLRNAAKAIQRSTAK